MKTANYQLIRENDGTVRFEGAYVKYYPGSAYCAVFEHYPAKQTRILICRQIESDHAHYGHHRCRLQRVQSHTTPAEVGCYTVLCEVSSEEEATKAVEANRKGMEALQKILQGRS